MAVPVLGDTINYALDYFSFGLAGAARMARDGDRYWICYNSTAGCRVRPWRISLQAFEGVKTLVDGAHTGEDIHQTPAVLPRAGGGLNGFWPWFGQPALNSPTNTAPPRWAAHAPAVTTPAGRGMPVRAALAPVSAWSTPGLSVADLQAVYDPFSRIGYLISDATYHGPAAPNAGFNGVFHRVLPDGTTDGPYNLVLSAAGQPPGAAPESANQVFVKASLKLRHGTAGPLPLYLLWETRNTFSYAPSTLVAGIGAGDATIDITDEGGYPSPAAAYAQPVVIDNEQITYTVLDSPIQLLNCVRGTGGTTAVSHLAGARVRLTPTHNSDLYCARSDDAGLTWKSLDGASTFALGTGVQWNDAAYRIWTYDHDQWSAYNTAIDPVSGYPLTVDRVQQPGTGWPALGHQNNDVGSFPGFPGTWDMKVHRWTGAAWVESVVAGNTGDAGQNVAFAGDGTAVVFYERASAVWYRFSLDRGATWSAEVQVGTIGGGNARPTVYVDHLRPNVIHLLWANSAITAGKWAELTVGPVEQVPATPWTKAPAAPPATAWSEA